MRVVEDDDHRRRKHCHFRKQGGEGVELAIRLHLAPDRSRRERLLSGRRAQCEQQQVHEPRSIVQRVERCPGDERALLEPAAAPLRQQGRLAESLRRGHDDGRALADLGPAFVEARARRDRPPEPRRCRLQQKVGVGHVSGPSGAGALFNRFPPAGAASTSIAQAPTRGSLRPPRCGWGDRGRVASSVQRVEENTCLLKGRWQPWR